MKFIGSRELRLNPTQVWEDLEVDGELILTVNGKPRAILTKADEANWEESLKAIRRARAQITVSALRQRSKKDVSLKDITKEVNIVRKKRRGVK